MNPARADRVGLRLAALGHLTVFPHRSGEPEPPTSLRDPDRAVLRPGAASPTDTRPQESVMTEHTETEHGLSARRVPDAAAVALDWLRTSPISLIEFDTPCAPAAATVWLPGHVEAGAMVPCPHGDHEHRVTRSLPTALALNLSITQVCPDGVAS